MVQDSNKMTGGECPICSVRIHDTGNLSEHIESHKPEEERTVHYYCNSCDKKFLYKKYLARHHKLKHGKDKDRRDHMCNFCDQGFQTAKGLTSHIRSHTKEHTFNLECKICGRKFYRRCKYKNHVYQLHNKHIRVVLERVNVPNETNLISICRKFKSQPNLLCPTCPIKGFKDNAALSKHIALHVQAKEPTNHCSICNVSFRNLKQHIEETHVQNSQSVSITSNSIESVKKPRRCVAIVADFDSDSIQTSKNNEGVQKRIWPRARCNLCKKTFNKKNLPMHIKVQHSENKKSFVCSIPNCGKAFGYKSHLNGHKKIHSEEKKYTCKYCPFKSKHSHSLQNHVRLHSSQTKKPFKCSFCDSSFYNKNHLSTHILTHIKEKTHLCAICNRGFTTSGNLRAHSKVHLELGQAERPIYSCSSCPSTFTLKDSLKKHIDLTHLKIKRRICSFCNKGFGTNVMLLNHVRSIHTGERPFKCSHCEKKFASKGQQSSHVRNVHLKIKRFPCAICGTAFSEKGSMERHVRIHTGEKPYKCRIDGCDEYFVQSQSRIVHERKRHRVEQVDWPCTKCNKIFKDKYQRNLHVRRIHVKEKRFKCPLCEKRFFAKIHCDDHVRNHTGETPYPCRHRHCEKCFTSIALRIHHEKKIHKNIQL